MTTKIRVVGLEYDREDMFKRVKLTFDLNHYKENISERDGIYALFTIEAKEGDFKIVEQKETLRFKEDYKPTRLSIEVQKIKEFHNYINIVGTQEWHDMVELFLQKLKEEDIYINLSLTRETVARLKFDFETKFERSIESY